MRWGRYFLGGGQFISRPFSHLEMQDFKNSNTFACGALIFNIHIFRFKTDTGLQVDIDFNINLNFLVQVAVSFTPYWALQTNQTHETTFFFIHLVGLEDPPNHPVNKARVFCVNVKKHGSY